MTYSVPIPPDMIRDFCERHHIVRLALFGSALRSDFGSHSDLDVLVEFDPAHIPGFAFFAMQDELSDLIGWPVDLHTPQFLSRHFRDTVQQQARVIYDARD